MGKLGVESISKNKVNYKLFEANISKESAYILGLLWADGHIRVKNKLTTINCILKDIDDIIPIFNKTGNWNISKPIPKTFNGKNVKTQRKISTTTWGLYYILEKYHYINKSTSSPIDIISIVPKKLKKYWYRGYLDGDGCIRLGKNYGVDVIFTGPYNNDWEFMINICTELNINYLIHNVVVKNGGYSHFRINKKMDVKKMCDYLYSDYKVDNMGFKRKHKKYVAVLNYIIKMDSFHWSDDDISFLIDNYKKMGGPKCSLILNKKLTSIYNKIRELKMKDII